MTTSPNYLNAYHLVCEECKTHSVNVFRKHFESCNYYSSFENKYCNGYSNISYEDLIHTLTTESIFDSCDSSCDNLWKIVLDFNATILIVTREMKHEECFKDCCNQNILTHLLIADLDAKGTGCLEYASIHNNKELFLTFISSKQFIYRDDEQICIHLSRAFCYAFIYNYTDLIDNFFSSFTNDSFIKHWFICDLENDNTYSCVADILRNIQFTLLNISTEEVDELIQHNIDIKCTKEQAIDYYDKVEKVIDYLLHQFTSLQKYKDQFCLKTRLLDNQTFEDIFHFVNNHL